MVAPGTSSTPPVMTRPGSPPACASTAVIMPFKRIGSVWRVYGNSALFDSYSVTVYNALVHGPLAAALDRRPGSPGRGPRAHRALLHLPGPLARPERARQSGHLWRRSPGALAPDSTALGRAHPARRTTRTTRASVVRRGRGAAHEDARQAAALERASRAPSPQAYVSGLLDRARQARGAPPSSPRMPRRPPRQRSKPRQRQHSAGSAGSSRRASSSTCVRTSFGSTRS